MILDKIVEKKKKSIKRRKSKISIEEMKIKAEEIVKKQSLYFAFGMSDGESYKLNIVKSYKDNIFKNVLKKGGLSIIGEFKKASPSKGIIVENFNVEGINNYYKGLGIDAYSVLTEEDFFLGSDEYLKEVKALSDTLILRKDFIIDFYQIYEAKILGATAVLLIVSILGNKLKDFYEECKKFKLEAIVEIHNKEELDIALECDVEIIGINNRDLKTFNTTLETTKELIKYIPKNKVIISESGMSTVEDLKIVSGYGADAALVGEMFMRNINNETFINEFKDFKDKEGKNLII